MRPRIAIPHPTTGDVAYNKLNWPAYAEAVSASGGEPVGFALDLSRQEALRMAATCLAIVLPGSPADVAPSRYGHAREDACAPADPLREQLDELLLEDAFSLRKPLLAICFGVQMMNVWRGGTLIQDLAVMPVNHSAGRPVAVAHTVAVAPNSALADLVDSSEAIWTGGSIRLPVNSSHHQAVAICGQGLKVSARCPQDGVIEAIEGESDEHLVLGVQWHPERTFHSSAASRAIFNRFIDEARITKTELVGVAV